MLLQTLLLSMIALCKIFLLECEKCIERESKKHKKTQDKLSKWYENEWILFIFTINICMSFLNIEILGWNEDKRNKSHTENGFKGPRDTPHVRLFTGRPTSLRIGKFPHTPYTYGYQPLLSWLTSEYTEASKSLRKKCEGTTNVLTRIISDMPFFLKTKWRAFKSSSLYLNKYWHYSLSMTGSTAGRLLSRLSGYSIGRKSHRKIALIQPSFSFNVSGRRIH